MTFSTNVPNASQSPGIFPAQMNTDLTRLKAIINGNHQFNDTVGVPNTDGFHRRVDYINPAVTPTIPAGADATGYTGRITFGSPTDRTEGFIRNAQGSMLTTGCRASVVFIGQTAIGNCTLRSFYNVARVRHTALGIYLIDFTFNMASNTYAIFCSSSVPTLTLCPGVDGTQTTGTATTNLYRTNTLTGADGDTFAFHVFIFGG